MASPANASTNPTKTRQARTSDSSCRQCCGVEASNYNDRDLVKSVRIFSFRARIRVCGRVEFVSLGKKGASVITATRNCVSFFSLGSRWRACLVCVMYSQDPCEEMVTHNTYVYIHTHSYTYINMYVPSYDDVYIYRYIRVSINVYIHIRIHTRAGANPR